MIMLRQTPGMAKSLVVRMTLQNLSKTSRTFSLEPYGDYCKLGPDQKVYATWEWVRLAWRDVMPRVG
jgi:hypothetical protein